LQMPLLSKLENAGAKITEREAVLLALTQAARNIPFFAVLALIVAFLPGWLGYVGTGIAIVFVAMLGVFLASDVFTLGMGLVLLVRTIFLKNVGPKPLWIIAGCLLNIVQGFVWIGAGYYVGREAGWWHL
jgi:hypothetical protein